MNSEKNRALGMGDAILSGDLPTHRARSDSFGISGMDLGRADANTSESAGISEVGDKIGLS